VTIIAHLSSKVILNMRYTTISSCAYFRLRLISNMFGIHQYPFCRNSFFISKTIVYLTCLVKNFIHFLVYIIEILVSTSLSRTSTCSVRSFACKIKWSFLLWIKNYWYIFLPYLILVIGFGFLASTLLECLSIGSVKTPLYP